MVLAECLVCYVYDERCCADGIYFKILRGGSIQVDQSTLWASSEGEWRRIKICQNWWWQRQWLEWQGLEVYTKQARLPEAAKGKLILSKGPTRRNWASGRGNGMKTVITSSFESPLLLYVRVRGSHSCLAALLMKVNLIRRQSCMSRESRTEQRELHIQNTSQGPFIN